MSKGEVKRADDRRKRRDKYGLKSMGLKESRIFPLELRPVITQTGLWYDRKYGMVFETKKISETEFMITKIGPIPMEERPERFRRLIP